MNGRVVYFFIIIIPTLVQLLVQFAMSENISYLPVKNLCSPKTLRIWIKNFRETCSMCNKKTFSYFKKRKNMANKSVTLKCLFPSSQFSIIDVSLTVRKNSKALSNNFIKMLYANK